MIARSSSTRSVDNAVPSDDSQHRRVLGGDRVQRQRHQHGPLALDQVVAGGLAGDLRVAEHAELVVAQLERLAQRQPEGGQLLEHLPRWRRPAPRRRAAAARWSTSRTCSAAPSSRSPRRPGRAPAPRRRGTGRRPPPSGRGRRRPSPAPIRSQPKPAAPEQLVGPGQQQVTEQDRGRGAVLRRGAGPAGPPVRRLERPVRRGPAAAGVGGVHVVVVDQGAGVQQLERRAGPEQRGLLVGSRRRDGPEAPVAERRAEPLAPGDRAVRPRRPGRRRRRPAASAGPPARRRSRRGRDWIRSPEQGGVEGLRSHGPSVVTRRRSVDGAVRPDRPT